MTYEGQISGNVVVPEHPLPFPDGTRVRIISGEKQHPKRSGRKSVAETSLGLIPADIETVQQVLKEDLYET